jgi:cell wall-associated NlpC family hydrolase
LKRLRYSYIAFVFLVSIFLVSCRSSKPSNPKPVESRERPSDVSQYEKVLGISLPNTVNLDFIKFISSWVGTPYKYGGNTTEGTDCSGFVNATYKSVFNKTISRSSFQLYQEAKPIQERDLREGDLLFFEIQGPKVSHVGMHVTGNYFIHASTRKGVIISSTEEAYYKQHFKGFGRVG